MLKSTSNLVEFGYVHSHYHLSSSIIHHPSSIIHHPSSIIHHLSPFTGPPVILHADYHYRTTRDCWLSIRGEMENLARLHHDLSVSLHKDMGIPMNKFKDEQAKSRRAVLLPHLYHPLTLSVHLYWLYLSHATSSSIFLLLTFSSVNLLSLVPH